MCGGDSEGGGPIVGLIGGDGVGVGILVTFDGVPVDVGGVVSVGVGVVPEAFVVVVDVVLVGFSGVCFVVSLDLVVGVGDFGLSSMLPCETNVSFM